MVIEEEGSDVQVKTSKYNNAIDQIYRMGIIWRNCYKHSSSGNYNSWNFDLDAIWRELGGDLNPEDKKNKKKIEEYDELNKKLMEVYPLSSQQAPTFNELPKDYAKKVGSQYQLLQAKELFLRRLQNQLGKGTAWNEEDEDDFG